MWVGSCCCCCCSCLLSALVVTEGGRRWRWWYISCCIPPWPPTPGWCTTFLFSLLFLSPHVSLFFRATTLVVCAQHQTFVHQVSVPPGITSHSQRSKKENKRIPSDDHTFLPLFTGKNYVVSPPPPHYECLLPPSPRERDIGLAIWTHFRRWDTPLLLLLLSSSCIESIRLLLGQY